MMQIWLSRLCTSMPMFSTAGLLWVRASTRIHPCGAVLPPHPLRPASRFIPSTRERAPGSGRWFLKLDGQGNKQALEALKDTKKKDHVRVDVTGEKSGDRIQVASLKLVE